MIDFFLQFLESQFNYQVILIGIVLYLASVWVMFSLWVFIDAKRRFSNSLVAVLLGLFVLPFNLPGLIFYLIIRPEEDLFGTDLPMYDGMGGGVNVPLVNYTGANGEVVMSLNLKMSPQVNPRSDMNINVDWNSSQGELTLSNTRPALSEMRDRQVNGTLERPSSDRLSSLKERAKGSFGKFHSAVKKSISKADGVAETAEESAAEEAADDKTGKKAKK